ncbi:MAG: peptidoglycan LD-endopeptidase LytH [Candidatus Petromonas sp.]|jgi:murein DD-endopeptidase MepM/ murein hydrolase activator NlpD|nr:peptidoglycan LD-endopeptidase LytH [Candidatus Petromonas sp.]
MIKKYLKRKLKLKIFLLVLLIFMIPLFIVSCVSVFTIFIAGSDEIEIAKCFDIPYEYLKQAYDEVEAYNEKVEKEKEKAKEKGKRIDFRKIDFVDVLVHSASLANLDVDNYDSSIFDKAIEKAINEDEFTGLEEFINEIFSKYYKDIETGPIPEKKIEYEYNKRTGKKEKVTAYYDYTSVDDFGADRTYGGSRRHEGNDIMADKGTPIVSMTDGKVTKMEWNDYGGWRIGITTDKGTYFYYAHLDRYEDGIKEGDKVKAGDVIGYVGDTGYGPPVTTGKFDPHLHLQIGIKLDENDEEYTWINPYNIVKFLDDFRVTLGEDEED